MPEDFWGRGIHSVAAIVGDNGVGKSTSIEFILQAIVDGANEKDVNGVLVYEQNGVLFVYSKDPIAIPVGVKSLKSPQKICCLYYCGHFQPFGSSYNLRGSELAGSYNISDGYLLIKDVQSYSNTDGKLLNLPIISHLNQYQARNNYRICLMLSNERLKKVISHFFKPKYIVFTENRSGAMALSHGLQLSYSGLSVPKLKNTHHDLRQRVLASHIYNNILNLICDITDGGYVDILNGWQEYMDDYNPVLQQFEEYVKKKVVDQKKIERLISVRNALDRLDQLAQFKDNILSGYYFIDFSLEYGKIKELCSIIEQSDYLVAQYFDIGYSQSLFSDTVLSSGELKLLDLFSRLYFAIQKDNEKFANLNAPALLILDEAEIAFHPAWQREYLQLVISFLQEMFVQADVSFQIMLSTHSPIILSDIPDSCVNFLHRFEDGTVKNVFLDGPGSFATNIFEQYRTSFFMGSGLIGEFAKLKLESILSRIEDLAQEKNNQEERCCLIKEINLIGDIHIRDYLMHKLHRDDVKDEIAYYMARIEELKRRHNE